MHRRGNDAGQMIDEVHSAHDNQADTAVSLWITRFLSLLARSRSRKCSNTLAETSHNYKVINRVISLL